MNDTEEIGFFLFLFILSYFLFRVGFRLAKNNLNGKFKWFAWAILVSGTCFGLVVMSKGSLLSPLGLLGFIPALAHIFTKIFNTKKKVFNTKNNSDHSTIKKIKGFTFTSIASSITYVITHAIFGFGIPEATVSAVIAAAILGIAGYTA